MMVGGEQFCSKCSNSLKEQNSQVKRLQPDEPLERPFNGAEGATSRKGNNLSGKRTE